MFYFDRREGDIAVLQDEKGEKFYVDFSLLPPESHEGSVLEKKEDCYVLNVAAGAERRKKLFNLLKNCQNNNEESD